MPAQVECSKLCAGKKLRPTLRRQLALLRPTNLPVGDQVDDPTESTANKTAAKKLFIEPTVSVPTDVQEATTFFQQPTIESAST